LGPIITENVKENPIESIEAPELKKYIEALYDAEFKDKDSATLEELRIGAKLAGS
jgi:hypothetical protein